MWCANEILKELIAYGETWYKRCTTENHREVVFYNFPQSEVTTLQTLPNIIFEVSMRDLRVF